MLEVDGPGCWSDIRRASISPSAWNMRARLASISKRLATISIVVVKAATHSVQLIAVAAGTHADAAGMVGTADAVGADADAEAVEAVDAVDAVGAVGAHAEAEAEAGDEDAGGADAGSPAASAPAAEWDDHTALIGCPVLGGIEALLMEKQCK
jgi:hypothetical protein